MFHNGVDFFMDYLSIYLVSPLMEPQQTGISASAPQPHSRRRVLLEELARESQHKR